MGYMENYELWLNDSDLKAEERAELVQMKEDEKLLEEAFTNPLAFGTAGMRGILGMGTNRMNVYTVMRATLGLANYINHEGGAERGVLIGYDTRNFSFEFATIAASVLEHNGINVYLYENVRPVPMVSFGVRELKAFAGIMITASHNPKEYNGYKVYGEDGAQLSVEASNHLTEYINGIKDYIGIPHSNTELTRQTVCGREGKLSDRITVVGEELDQRFFAAVEGLMLSPEAVKESKGLKIVYTPLHGAGYKPVTRMIKKMGIDLVTVPEQAIPDGNFSTVAVPNPEQSEALDMAIRLADEVNADAVIGTDPDCDRMGVAIREDGKMTLLTGNQIGSLMLDYVLTRKRATGKLPENAVAIKSIVTSCLAEEVCKLHKVPCVNVLTGFKFFGEKIKEWESTGEHTYAFGFEESYGYLAGTHARDKDAVSASMLFAEMVCYYKSKGISVVERLNQLYEAVGYFYDKTVSTFYKGLNGMEKMAGIMEKLRTEKVETLGGLTVEYISDYRARQKTYLDGRTEALPQGSTNAMYFGFDCGWVCARPSGTEPKLKYYISVGGRSMDEARAKAEAIEKDFASILNG